MKQFSISLGKPFGIPTRIHWTFWILILWIVYTNASQGAAGIDTLWYILFVFAIFTCVVLHELGHALAARRYGIGTRSITILPIGGVASLEKMPDRPVQELVVAIAGPMVNVLIALALGVSLSVSGSLSVGQETLEGMTRIEASNFLLAMFFVNIMLVIFNMIPAFPMDGGRVLRAILAMSMSKVKATEWAVNVGKLFAILFVFWGFSSNPFLIFIALFIVISAQGELEMVRSAHFLHSRSIRDVVMKDYTLLDENSPLSSAVEALLNGQEKQFLVANDREITGILTKNEIIQGLTKYGKDSPIGQISRRDVSWANEDDKIEEIRNRMLQNGIELMPIGQPGNLVGVVDVDNINEFLLIQYALDRK